MNNKLSDVIQKIKNIIDVDKLAERESIVFDNQSQYTPSNELRDLRIKKSAFKYGFKKGYKAATENLYSLQDIEKAFIAGQEYGDANCETGGNTKLPNRIEYISNLQK